MLAAVRRALSGELLFPQSKPKWATLDISPRQREVLALLCKGHPNKEIGRCLGLSENTVRSHVAVIFRELGVNTRTEAAMAARRHGLD
ncbi:Putative HTH-type transcriptional regulator YhjB [Burkholderiales bacterium]|nr:Putative HTH-type transcriptional regulator YhjB [Burkholderiales bacterium]